MAGRRVFFSFHYEQDVWRAAIVRKTGVVDAVAAAGWSDASLWEAVKRQGDSAIKRAIQAGLQKTTVTAVLIGSETSERRWVNYEIEESIKRGNGLLGVRIHRIKDQRGHSSTRGRVPRALRDHDYRIYDWDREKLGRWVEWAAIDAGRPCLAHAQKSCSSCRRGFRSIGTKSHAKAW